MDRDSRKTLVIENRLAELARLERWLAGLLEQWGIKPEAGFRVDLVINEAVTNVVRHAYPEDTTQTLSLSLTDTPGGVIIEIVDGGIPFNPFDAPEMASARNLEEASIGGRGIHLMKAFADDYDYSRVSGQNRLTLVISKDTDPFEPHTPNATRNLPSRRDFSR